MHIIVLLCSLTLRLCNVGDHWRVLLFGDAQNYIHAVAVNVRTFSIAMLTPHIANGHFTGLQAPKSFLRSSKSHAVYCQGFLEDGLRQEVWSGGNAL